MKPNRSWLRLLTCCGLLIVSTDSRAETRTYTPGVGYVSRPTWLLGLNTNLYSFSNPYRIELDVARLVWKQTYFVTSLGVVGNIRLGFLIGL